MNQDDKPIFPRPSEISDEEKQRLHREAGRNLENEERNVFNSGQSIKCPVCQAESRAEAKFCRQCGSNFGSKTFVEPASLVYGPPPMMFDEKTRDDIHTTPVQWSPENQNDKFEEPRLDDIHATAYGPPPMMLDEREESRIPIPVYGPPAMMLDERRDVFPLSKTVPDFKIDNNNLPSPVPVKNESSKNHLVWIIGAVVLAALLFLGLVAIGILFFILSR